LTNLSELNDITELQEIDIDNLRSSAYGLKENGKIKEALNIYLNIANHELDKPCEGLDINSFTDDYSAIIKLFDDFIKLGSKETNNIPTQQQPDKSDPFSGVKQTMDQIDRLRDNNEYSELKLNFESKLNDINKRINSVFANKFVCSTLEWFEEIYSKSNMAKCESMYKKVLAIEKIYDVLNFEHKYAYCGILMTIGELFYEKNQFELALPVLEKSLYYSKILNAKLAIPKISIMIGKINSSLNLYARSETYLIDGLKSSEQIQDDTLIATSLTLLGDLNLKLGKFQESLDYYYKALKRF